LSFSAERSAIEGRFQTLWVSGSPAAARTPVGYDGHPFTPANNSIRLTIRNGGAEQMSMGDPGNNLVRNVGVIFLEVYTEGGKGSTASRVYEDLIVPIFINKVFDGVRCRVPYLSGEREEVPFLVRTMAVPFERDELIG